MMLQTMLFQVRYFLPLLFAFLAVPAMLAADAKPLRPHIVFILADDLGSNDLGYHGGTHLSPNLDAIAKTGQRLEQYYVQPVCSPTRAALMTGRYPCRHGLQVGVVRPWAQYGLPLEERTLPQALSEVGYKTAITGKWHLGHFQPEYLPTRRGFAIQYGHYNGMIDYMTKLRDSGYDWHRNDRELRQEGYTTDLIGAEAAKIVREHDPQQPLFLYIPFNAVHTPIQAPPEKYMAKFPNLKGEQRIYAAMVYAMDAAVGEVIAALDQQQMRDNTLIIFSSDNGGFAPGKFANNGKLRAGKGTLYEGGVRSSAIACWPKQLKPGECQAMLHTVDWYPTLLKLAGAKTEQKLPLDGMDIWSCLANAQPSPHEEILCNVTPSNGSAIRVGDWKLVVGGDLDIAEEPAKESKRSNAKPMLELFQLKDDPSETKNLADQHPDKVQQLLARIKHYADGSVAPKNAPKGKDFVTPKVWGEKP
jgi:arylsulfatase A-like enzyme